MTDLFAEKNDIKIGFESETIELPIEQILPIKPMSMYKPVGLQ